MNIDIASCIRQCRINKRPNVIYAASGWKLQCLATNANTIKQNKFLVFVVEDVYMNYFVEYIKNLDLFDATLTFQRANAHADANNAIDFASQIDCVFVIAQNLMVSIEHWALQRNCCLLITEQLTEQGFLQQAKDFVQRGGVVLTYSEHNQMLLGVDVCHCLLYQYAQEENETLRGYAIGANRMYDVAMVPCRFQRRLQIRDALRKAGLSVLEIDDKWGAERDRGVANCRILLNVHVRQDYTVYEHFRCDRWLFLGQPTVVSEQCVNQASLDCADLIQFASYDEIVGKCCNIVATEFQQPTATKPSKRVQEIAASRLARNQAQLKLLLHCVAINNTSVAKHVAQPFIAQYGTDDFKVDVTDTVRQRLCNANDGWLSIEPSINFNHLFGDVATNLPKKLYLRGGVTLPEGRNKTFEGDYFTTPSAAAKIPIFIISHNRLTMIKRCVEAIRQCFDADTYEIVVHDNVSTYQPLIEYLQGCGLHVYWNKRNELDDVALSVQRYFAETGSAAQYYAVTDPDVEFQVGVTPSDTMAFYTRLLDTHPSITTVGPELRVDDIPDHYPLKQDLLHTHKISHANDRFIDVAWCGKVVKCAYRKLDTTFGVYRRNFTFHRLNDAILCHDQYCARHLDWYIDPDNMAPDDLLYMQKTTRWGHWSSEYLRPLVKK